MTTTTDRLSHYYHTKVEANRIAAEISYRLAARGSFLQFCREVYPDFIESEHHRKMAAKLEDIEAGRTRRAMFFVPRRHSKSTMISQLFPCWMFGKHPNIQIVQSGYGAAITLEHSRKARDLFVSAPTRRIFPGVHHSPERAAQRQVAVERQAAHEWGTTQGGRYYAVGIGGGLVGRGADIAIIDDPVKNREEAESHTKRKTAWDWYRSSLYPALSPTGVVIVVQTRWHPEDLAGMLIKDMESGEGDKWDVLSMPAINEDGEALWPDRWPVERLNMIRRASGKHEWASQYQQQPSLRGGNMFYMAGVQWHKRNKDGSVDGWPDDLRYVRFWDLASTLAERASDDPDYTAGAKVAVTHDTDGLPHLWVRNVVAVQKEAPERDRTILSATDADGAAVPIYVESVAGYKDTVMNLRAILRGKRSVRKVTVSKDKVVRAAPLEPIFEAGNVHAVADVPWSGLFDQHFREFPSGAHDDVVDAVAGAYAALAKKQSIGDIDRRALGF